MFNAVKFTVNNKQRMKIIYYINFIKHYSQAEDYDYIIKHQNIIINSL